MMFTGKQSSLSKLRYSDDLLEKKERIRKNKREQKLINLVPLRLSIKNQHLCDSIFQRFSCAEFWLFRGSNFNFFACARISPFPCRTMSHCKCTEANKAYFFVF